MGSRVFIWSGHPLFARAMEALLGREEMEVVGTATDPVEAIPAIVRLRPDVVVADRIVEREHLRGIAEVVRVCQRVRVLVIDLLEDAVRTYDRHGCEAGRLAAIVHAIQEAAASSAGRVDRDGGRAP